MKRAFSIVVACGLVAAVSGEARQRPASPGVVVEVVEKGSAPDLAGIKAGDELVSWTRSASTTGAAAEGQFRTPFDARDFELEQLPRGGTTVTYSRNGSPAAIRLTQGFWGVTARSALNAEDLATYNAGRPLEKDRPAESLAAWRPLIDRFVAAGDIGNATWLLTRTGSAFAALDQIEQADAVFTEAVDRCARSSNLALEAMVWDAKGRAYHPEAAPPAVASPLTRPRLEAGLTAHSRAWELRRQLEKVLASAESQLLSGFVITWGVQSRKLPESTEEEKEAFTRSGVWIQEALAAIAKEAPGSLAHARALAMTANHFYVSGLPVRTKNLTTEQAAAIRGRRLPYLREARQIFARVAPTHDLLRTALQSLYGNVAARTDREGSAEAEDLARALIQFAERTADRALLESSTRSLALKLSQRGDLDGALAVLDGLVKTGTAPGSLAAFIVDLAIDAYDKGALDDVTSILERQARLIDPTSAVGIRIALRLVDYHGDRGDYAAAERALLPLVPRLDDPAVSPAQRGDILFKLANTAGIRGEYDLAEIYAARALKETDQGPATAGWRQNYLEFLSVLADARGDREAAKQFVRQSIALAEAQAQPNEWNQLLAKIQLARLDEDRDAVTALTEQKLALARRLQPGGQKEAQSLYDAGLVKLQHDQDAEAIPYLRDALSMIRRLEPRSLSLAKTLSLLGMAEGTTNGWQAGIAYLEEAMDLLEDRRLGAGQDGARDLMRGEFSDVYVKAVDLLVKGGRYERAFDVIERSRARALVDMLATRDLRVGSVPVALRLEQRQVGIQLDAMADQLANMTMADTEAIANANVELDKLRLQLNELDRRVSQINPTASARLRPAPLTLAQVQARLDKGTVLLSYLPSWKSTYLFVVTPVAPGAASSAGLSVYTLPVSEDELRQSISTFNTLIEWDRDPATARRADLIASGRDLYDRLIRPAEAHIDTAERVLLNLDGPLLSLEFSALVRNSTGEPTYVVEWKRFHRAPSMAVYAQILESRRPTGKRALVAFADPDYTKRPAAPVDELKSLLRSGATLSSLPGTKLEAQAIAKLFAPNAVTFVGNEATESRAKAIARTTRYVHFAVHGFFNDRRPLDSGLVLTISGAAGSGDGNGILEAWEIFEHVRLDADLVTLSACETGVGKGSAGEGLAGLTSAFLYAGARSVVASQWKVADGPTTELMTLFYANLKKGQWKDQALQNAQRELLRLGRLPGAKVDYSSPAHWAAFSLTGDWR